MRLTSWIPFLLPVATIGLSSIWLSLGAAPTPYAVGWWLAGDASCPDNATLRGAAPPAGVEIGCAKPSGVWHGPRTTWFACVGEGGCDPTRPPVRYHGEYRRGIEHGHWIWWREDGSKGLEGDYYAGKKTGTWHSYGSDGNVGTTEFLTYSQSIADIDSAIQTALETAKAMGNQQFARELDDAARDLKRTVPTDSRRLDGARGQAAVDKSTLDTHAEVGVEGGDLDLPTQDLGSINFGAEGTAKVSPYVKRAVNAATKKVNWCYRKARQRRPNLSGELVSRFSIARNGRVESVRIVRSDLTETMNRCVKKGLSRLKLKPHQSPSPVEVISPWTLRAGRR